jgi:hypothetical protein
MQPMKAVATISGSKEIPGMGRGNWRVAPMLTSNNRVSAFTDGRVPKQVRECVPENRVLQVNG